MYDESWQWVGGKTNEKKGGIDGFSQKAYKW